jgi:hypothetical protein
MKFAFAVTLLGILLTQSSGQQATEKITFHVSSVKSEDAKDMCSSTDKCTATRFTVEGYTDTVEYVLDCVEIRNTTPPANYVVVCPNVHAHNDYLARLGLDYIAFERVSESPSTGPSVSTYHIVSEREVGKRKQ